MHKIPTLFKRDSNFKVINELNEKAEWVNLYKHTTRCIPTEKLDGTNIRITIRSNQIVRIEKRRNPTRDQKEAKIFDPWYVDVDKSAPENKWIMRAVTDIVGFRYITNKIHESLFLPDGEHCCEALGPFIQGNPLSLDFHCCVPFNFAPPILYNVPLEYNQLRGYLKNLKSVFSPYSFAEGIVFHHPDGSKAKIKTSDFSK